MIATCVTVQFNTLNFQHVSYRKPFCLLAPSCPSGYKLVNGICVCSNGLSGPKCDRDLSICSRTTCAINEVCVSHVSATNR